MVFFHASMSQHTKEIALQFLTLVTTGKIDEAYEAYVDRNGKHHNVYFPAGFEHLKNAMKENHAAEPNKAFTPKNVFCDGELVAVHSHLVRSANAPEMSVVHMFRIRDGKIVEMWDCGMQIPADCPNMDGAF